MNSRAGSPLVTILRSVAGFLLVLAATPFLIQGGFSRYAKYGTPAHPDWRYLAIAAVMLAAGSFLIRPFWWRHPGRR